MSKNRMNPTRRRLAAQAKLLKNVLHDPNLSKDVEGKGVIRSSLSPKTHLVGYRPIASNWEGLGQKGFKGKKVWSKT